MALPFFYHSALTNVSVNIQLEEDTSKHVVQVLRMKEGDRLNLTNGTGLLALAEVAAANKKICMVKIVESSSGQKSSRRKSAIAISPVKNNSRFEWFLEKATELGISEIIPLICTRTEREHFRYERMNAICISAMLQSQQTWLPVLHQPTSFQNFLQSDDNYKQKWIAHCTEEIKEPLVSSLTKEMEDSPILVGPEGDFTTEEIQAAMAKGYHAVSLGDTRLRTETAGIVAATLLLLC